MAMVTVLQKSHDDRMDVIEEEIKNVRTEMREVLRPLKSSYTEANGQ